MVLEHFCPLRKLSFTFKNSTDGNTVCTEWRDGGHASDIPCGPITIWKYHSGKYRCCHAANIKPRNAPTIAAGRSPPVSTTLCHPENARSCITSTRLSIHLLRTLTYSSSGPTDFLFWHKPKDGNPHAQESGKIWSKISEAVWKAGWGLSSGHAVTLLPRAPRVPQVEVVGH